MRPQDEIPVEKIIHYIVKDYRRMFLEFDALENRALKAEAKVAAMREKNLKMSSELGHIRKVYDNKLAEMQKDRDVVVQELMADLNSKLNAANRKNNLLMQALQDPNAINVINTHTIDLDEDKEWMDRAMGQLEKAMLNFVSIESRLYECEKILDNATEDIIKDGIIKRMNKALTKINSCVSHIEDFFTKVGNLKTNNNGQSN